MPDRSGVQTKQEKLAQATNHIATAEALIARQMSLLAELERDGHNIETARALLDTMHQSLQQMYAHLQIIEAEPEP
jgi:ribosomal 50S subunit-associated protein YjgA (DUF615 family)